MYRSNNLYTTLLLTANLQKFSAFLPRNFLAAASLLASLSPTHDLKFLVRSSPSQTNSHRFALKSSGSRSSASPNISRFPALIAALRELSVQSIRTVISRLHFLIACSPPSTITIFALG